LTNVNEHVVANHFGWVCPQGLGSRWRRICASPDVESTAVARTLHFFFALNHSVFAEEAPGMSALVVSSDDLTAQEIEGDLRLGGAPRFPSGRQRTVHLRPGR